MPSLSRRTYLLGVGSAAVALPVSVVGAVDAVGRPGTAILLDFDRKSNGDVDFDDPETGTRFRTRGDELKFDDDFARCRERPSEARSELRRVGAPGSLLTELDIDRRPGRDRIRLDVQGEAVDYEKTADRQKFRTERSLEAFEDDGDPDGDIEFRGRLFDFDVRAGRVDIKRALRFRFNGVDSSRLQDVGTDLRSDVRRFRSRSERLDIDFDRATQGFEARRIL
jgi:hypothetical protein